MLEVDAAINAVLLGSRTIEGIVSNGLEHASADPFGAWVALDPKARTRAQEDDSHADHRPLTGVTIGVKDLFAVAGLPLRAGSSVTPPEASRVDAAVVCRLRGLGAQVLGTTSMPEFAYGPTPGARNPLDPKRTPGSSSAGSAIAVAAGHVAVGLASQTNGSIIRPASYCGVAGLKPSQGAMPIDGMLRLVPTLDQPGLIAASAESLQTLWSAWQGKAPPPDAREPRVALVRTSHWHHVEPGTRAIVEDVARSLGAAEVKVPRALDEAWSWMDTIISVELAANLAVYADRDELTSPIRDVISVGRATPRDRYRAALAGRRAMQEWAATVLADLDAIITPATAGPAPRLEEGAGSPEFCTLWSLAGLPAITLPAPGRNDELPVGVQFVSASGRDSSLLELAASLERTWRAEAGRAELRSSTRPIDPSFDQEI